MKTPIICCFCAEPITGHRLMSNRSHEHHWHPECDEKRCRTGCIVKHGPTVLIARRLMGVDTLDVCGVCECRVSNAKAIVAEAKAWAERMKARGWTKEDFANSLKVMLDSPTGESPLDGEDR